jgi:CBS domain-containing protein
MDVARTDSTVATLLSSETIVVWPDTPVSEVAALLDASGASGIPVVDWSGYLAGVVSQLDIVRVRASDNLSVDWSRLCARHVMSQAWLTVAIDTPLEVAAHLVESLNVGRLVVVVEDDGESPIGVLSATDLAGAIAGR